MYLSKSVVLFVIKIISLVNWDVEWLTFLLYIRTQGFIQDVHHTVPSVLGTWYHVFPRLVLLGPVFFLKNLTKYIQKNKDGTTRYPRNNIKESINYNVQIFSMFMVLCSTPGYFPP